MSVRSVSVPNRLSADPDSLFFGWAASLAGFDAIDLGTPAALSWDVGGRASCVQ